MAGKVLRVKLYTDSNGASKGHGTVEYEHPVEAVQAISMFNEQKLYGRPMSIRMDKYEPEETPDVLPSKLPSGLEGVGKGLGIGGQPLNVSKSLLGANAQIAVPVTPPTPVAPMGAAPIGHHVPPPLAQQGGGGNDHLHHHSLNLSNIDSRALSNLVSQSGGLGGALGSALASVSSGLRAQQTPPQPMYNSYETDYRRDLPDVYGPGPGPVDAVVGSAMRPPSDTVVVRNLPQNFDWKQLRDRFSEVGDISYAELKGPGTAVIRFHFDRSAQRAVSQLHGLRFEGRSLEVNYYY